jgi:hypothetical protein
VVADTISRSFAVDLGTEVQSQSHVVVAPVTEKDQQLLIRSMHNELVGHHGIEMTMHILFEAGFGWDGMRQMVKEMISNCLGSSIMLTFLLLHGITTFTEIILCKQCQSIL